MSTWGQFSMPDSYWDPPEYTGRSGVMEYYVERPVPRDDEEGECSVEEFEALVTFDEGGVWSASINGTTIELTDDERRHAEDMWAESEDDDWE